MEYYFTANIINTGTRTFIVIPFNVWEVCKQKGLIPVEVKVNDISFECRLMSKGNGFYYIPVNKDILKKLY